MESPYPSNTHRAIAAASLASLAAMLAAIRAHPGEVHEDDQTSAEEHSDQDGSSFGADGNRASPMHRTMNQVIS